MQWCCVPMVTGTAKSWMLSLAHGEGCAFFADGRVLQKGLFHHGLLVIGFAFYPAFYPGDTYVGSFDADGWRHGQGKLTTKDSVVKEGTWRNAFMDDKLLVPRVSKLKYSRSAERRRSGC